MQHNKKWPTEEVSQASVKISPVLFYISFREHSFPSLKICTLRLAKIPISKNVSVLT